MPPYTDTTRAGPTRRSLLTGAAAWATGSAGASAGQLFPPATTAAGLITHLLRRATFGPNPTAIAHATALGPTAWLAEQFAPATLVDPTDDIVAARYPDVGRTPSEVSAVYDGAFDVGPLRQVQDATVVRAVASPRQLQEVMTDFWSNHFNVTTSDADVWATRGDYDRVLRANALGSFRDLLAAVVKHPALLIYLNANLSTSSSLNENLGRELLELHTVGLDAGFTQADVVDSARILTGASCTYPASVYTWVPAWHSTGEVRVLGFTDANAAPGREAVLDAYLAYLATHPSTARHVCRKLAVRFVSDAPTDALVDRLATVYRDGDTAIVPVLQALFADAEFAASVGQKTRRPAEDVYATFRAMDLTDDQLRAVPAAGWSRLSALTGYVGQTPFAHGAPDGYPDTADAYVSVSQALARMNVHSLLGFGAFPELAAAPAYLAVPPPTLGAFVDALAHRLFAAPLTAAHRSAICGFFGLPGTVDVSTFDPRALEFAIGPLLLDSPYFTNR